MLEYEEIMVVTCDVTVVGAGPAGAATALHLARAGCSVVLLDRSKFASPRVGESLAPDVQPLLASLGLWSQFLALKPLPSYGIISAWGGSEAQVHSHLITAYLNGWHIDRLAFDRMLGLAAVRSGTNMFSASWVTRIRSVGRSGFILDIADSENVSELHTKFLVDASGRHSYIPSWLGAQRILFDRLVGVAAQFYDEEAYSNCYTLVEASQTGWWYSAPVSRDHSVAILMTDGDLVRMQGTYLLANWQKALNRMKLTEKRLHGCSTQWGPRIFSAVSQRQLKGHSDSKPWLSVGDAALSVDPISGSGVIRALRTAREAAAAALAALNGDSEALVNYEIQRNAECTEYLIKRTLYYDMEKRWPDAPFWKRRAIKSMQLKW